MLNNNNPAAALTWWDGSCAFNAKMREQALDIADTVPSNYRYYIGTGSRHTMWGSNKGYTDTTGGVPTLVDWITGMLDGTPAWINVEAQDEGLLLAGDPRPSPLQPPFFQVGSDVKIICDGGGSPSGALLATERQRRARAGGAARPCASAPFPPRSCRPRRLREAVARVPVGDRQLRI